ncbi:hypothetical protein BG015_008243 [Linnemannia schmuckeri]|uniref:Uncharacterized protein n=1 Tax=Linnemannia schmuckeri TaxID=64567 RepID=A0A9P5VAP0_9FUNG|nr:hypothetical protein BG015_008243 [Linnemannia schmuckeri]
MVSLVLLILAPVLILTAVIIAGVALFTPGPSKPKPKILLTLTTPVIPTSKVIFTTQILPEKEKITASLIPSNIVTTKPIHPIVDNIPPMSLSSAVVTTAFQIPKIVTATSRVPRGVTTISRDPEAVTTTFRIPEVVTTESTAPPPPPVAVATTTTVAKKVPIPAFAPAVPSDANIKEKNKDDKDRKSDEEEEEDCEDDEESGEDCENDEEEEEEDESSNINGISGIQADDASDSRHVETVKYKSGFRTRKNGQVVDARAKFVNKKKSVVVEELQKRINEIVKEQSVPFETELARIMADLLDSRNAAEYQDVLSHIGTTQQEGSDSIANDSNSDKDAVTQTALYAQADGAAPASGLSPRELLNTLLQPFIIQFRTDVRNTTSPSINDNDGYAKKAAQDDITATTHPDGVHFADLYDLNTAALAIDCLKTHFGRLTIALGKLFVDRFAAAREFLLKQVGALAGIPRFLVPFSDKENKDTVAVTLDDASSSEAEKERIERSGAFAQWLVDSMVHEIQLAVEQDQDLASGGRRNIAAVANLPDTEEMAQVQSKEVEASHPPTEAGAAAREPSQPGSDLGEAPTRSDNSCTHGREESISMSMRVQ